MYCPPPPDLTLPEIFDFHRQTNPSHPLFCYDSERGVETITWAKASIGIENVARSVAHVNQSVVAILAAIDQISYFALIAGVIRAGHCAFPISPRNSDAAVADLLQRSGATFMFVSSDNPMQRLARAGCAAAGVDLQLLDIPTFTQIYTAMDDLALPSKHCTKRNATALILHSSGSTSFPKPIYLSHKSLVEWGLQPRYGEVDISGRVLSNHALPLFHAMGIVSLCWAVTTGVILSNFAPKSPPRAPTPENVFSSLLATKSHLVFCVPTFLEEWAQDNDKMESLKGLDAIMFGGAPINQKIGDMLYHQGVKIYPFYGATELGGVSQFLLERPPEAGWEYFKVSPHATAHFISEGGEKEICRLFFETSTTHSPATLNAEVEGASAYDTNDLLVCHPTAKDLWKIYGRADDQIMHSTGEKTNPVPIETIINLHPTIANAIVFGRGRFQAGVLVKPHASLLLDRPEAIAGFIADIWPQIKGANKVSPSHSRIFKEMILIAKPDKPFLYTAKGTPRRQAIISIYEQEIRELYNTNPESKWLGPVAARRCSVDFSTIEGCADFIRATFAKALQLEISVLANDDDILQHGCDSLQAIWIRNEVLSAIGQYSGETSKRLSSNLVYTYPTVVSLAHHIHQTCNNGTAGHQTEEEKTLDKMRDLVEKYSQGFATHRPSGFQPKQEAVLLTGSTGGLGSYLLESLVLNPDIARVFVLNRPHASLSCVQRQLRSFHERGIDPNFLDFSKIRFLEGELALAGLGLKEETYEELRLEVTCIMHIAWRVDFNVGLSSMEPLIVGTRNLVDFALSSGCDKPPRFLFASSIGVLRNFPGKIAAEAAVLDPRVALGSGYPESKWVAEQVLTRARELTTLSPVIVRIGQLSGGRNGHWNPCEWVPGIVRSGEIFGCLPRSSGLISWLPVHAAASALTEIRACAEPFLHFVHPAPIPWNDLAELFSEALLVPQVSYQQWLSHLEKDGRSPSRSAIESNPALKILEFYQSVKTLAVAEDAEAFGFPRLSTAQAMMNARSLRPPTLQPLDRKDVAGWILYWRSKGLLQVPGFDANQYTSTLLTATRGLRPYLSYSSRQGQSSSRFPSSSIPALSALSSQNFNFEQTRKQASWKVQIMLLVSNLLLWVRLALSFPVRLLANLQSLDRGT